MKKCDMWHIILTGTQWNSLPLCDIRFIHNDGKEALKSTHLQIYKRIVFIVA